MQADNARRLPGHNYGVVVSATFRIYDPIDNNNWINANYYYDASQIPVVISHINRFRSIQPATMTIFFYFGPDMGSSVMETAPPILHVSAQYGGPPDEFLELVRPFAVEFKPFKSTNATTPWNQVNRYNQAGKDTGLCMSGTRKAMFSELLKTYDVNDMVASYDFLKKMREENPQLARSVMLFESYPLQAFKRVKNEDTAYPHRDMNIITQVCPIPRSLSLMIAEDIF